MSFEDWRFLSTRRTANTQIVQWLPKYLQFMPCGLNRNLHQQKIAGGRIGDNLIALGYITREKLETILQEPPSVAKTIEETGLDTNFLLNSILRIMYISALQTIPEIAEQIKLTRGVVESLLDFAKKEALVE